MNKILKLINVNPVLMFVATAVVVVLLFLTKAENEFKNTQVEDKPVIKQVEIFEEQKAVINTIATAQNSGIVNIIAQTSGIVSYINVRVGQKVSSGTQIISIANNYTSGNAAQVQANISTLQYETSKNNLEEQLNIINVQKELANKGDENSEELRKITEASLSDTQNLLDDNRDVLDSQTISQLEATIRSLSYQANSDNAINKLPDLSKELSIKQLELHEKSLHTQLEISRLASVAANINASLFSPASPSYGIVEAIYVSKNQVVSPGTLIATIKTSENKLNYVAYIPSTIYKYLDLDKKGIININNEEILVDINYVSIVPVKGLLHQVRVSISKEDSEKLAGLGYLNLSLNLNTKNNLIPLSALHQSKSKAFVYVVVHGVVETKEVTIGAVAGEFVEIFSGISENEKIITSRNVIAGDLTTK